MHSGQFYDTPGAGPSRLSSDHLGYDLHDDDEDNELTPRLSNGAKLASEKNSPLSYTHPALPTESHPVNRLRSLLARAKDTPPPRQPESRSPSDVASDFEPLNPSTTSNSIASQSLKELFSRVRREPGDTPKKTVKRRNSIDASEVEDSPRLERVWKERVSYKGKRRSMSDEEAEMSVGHSRKSEVPHRSSAATFDALRQRLSSSTSKPSEPSEPESDGHMEVSGDTATILKHLDDEATTPVVENTMLRSMAMPSQLQMHSNLMEQDSEMQRAMGGVESSEAESATKRSPPRDTRRLAFPSGRRVSGPQPSRPLSWTSHSKSHDHNNLPPVRRVSEEFDRSSSRASSSTSNVDNQRQGGDKFHDKERNWNRPNGRSPAHIIPSTPERIRHYHSNSSPSMGRGSPSQYQSRRLSAASLQSLNDENLSRSSSVSSKSEYREQIKEIEEERNKQREHQWNRPQPRIRTMSTASQQSPGERMRTYSTPSRPDSAASYLSPEGHRRLSRHPSMSSISGSSRATSPSSSAASREGEKEQVDEVQLEVRKEREHNWNSPRPRWVHGSSRRSVSPLPSPSGSPSTSGIQFRMSTSRRALMDESFPGQSKMDLSESLGAPAFPNRTMSSPSRTINGMSRLPRLSTGPRPKSEFIDDFDFSRTESASRFGYQFPPHHATLPEADFGPEGAERPSSRLSVHDQNKSTFPSHIPIRSPGRRPRTQSQTQTQTSPKGGSERRREKEKRRSLIDFTEQLVSIPPPIPDQPEPESEPEHEPESAPELRPPVVNVIHAQDEIHDSDQEPISSTSTPIAKPIALPTDTPPASPPRHLQEEYRDNNAIPAIPEEHYAKPESPPPTPPPTQPEEPPRAQTPPRRSFQSTSLEFQTPSPPRFLPDLPGPPPESEDETSDQNQDQKTPIHFETDRFANFTMTKTPRPPGAWVSTPAAQFERDLISRPSSTPPERVPSLLDTTGPVSRRPATLSKMHTLPPEPTPAPPGAWVPTPGTARRKSILKVRFDVQNRNVSSDGFPEVPVVGPNGINPPYADSDSNPLLDTPPQRASNGPDKKSAIPVKHEIESSLDEDSPSPSNRPVKKSKSPTIRVLDAYGRETPNVEPPAKTEDSKTDDKKSRAVVKKEEPPTPRNRSAIRIVDAMGREVQEPPPQTPDYGSSFDDEPSTPLSHNEALARVRQTIAHLAEDLDEVDRSCDELAHNENHISALENTSKAARNARKRISESLQLVKTAEDDLRSKLGSLRNGMTKSKLLPGLESDRPQSWSWFNTWTISIFVILQVVMILAMYRHSKVTARKLFLSTYYDPFNPDIYSHLTNPEGVRHSLSYSFSWSPLSIPDAISREGWKGVASELWGNVTCLATDIQHHVWEAWSAKQRTNAWKSWPPT
ncbi:hypothetical protein QCA50_004534 [Cerrena zonata]|uniref:Uncharacterized protein n=1 Tax=Cerrena zonata TaxID=2478898 RepID=A0AAW0GPC0_9APHY